MSMLPLGSSEIEQMRDVMGQSLSGTAVLQSPTRSSDGQGGETWAYAAAGTVSARLMPLPKGASEMALSERLGVINPFILTVPADTTVSETFRAVFDSRTLEIKSILPRAPWEISLRMLAEEVS